MKNKQTLLGFILLALSFSQLAVSITQKITGANFIEPILIAGIYLLNKDSRYRIPITSTVLSKTFISGVIFLFCFFVIGILTSGDPDLYYNSPIRNCYADLRTLILILFIFILFTNKNWIPYNRNLFIKSLLWPFIIFDVIATRVLISNSTETVRILGSVPSAVIILMAFYLNKGKYLISLLLITIIGYHAVISSSRNYIVIFLVAFVLFNYYLFFKKTPNKYNFFARGLSIFCLVVIPIVIAPLVYDFWMKDTRRRMHTIERSQNVIESGGANESERINSVIQPFVDSYFYLIPAGLGWRNHINKIQKHYPNGEVISSMDSTFYYQFYHFGFLIGLIINISIFVYILRSLFFKNNKKYFFIKFIFSFLFLASFFTKSTMMAMIQFAFGNALLIALVHKRISF
jgi:hypothetical protein